MPSAARGTGASGSSCSLPATCQKVRCRLPDNSRNAPASASASSSRRARFARSVRSCTLANCACAARRHDALRGLLAQAFHHAQTQPQRGLVVRRDARACNPSRLPQTLDRPHFNSVIARVAHQLRRRVETHGLAVDERAGESRGLMTLEPRGAVHQQRETRGVRLGKAVFAEALDLAEDLARETFVVTARAHAVDEPLLEMPEAAAPLPGRHAPAQLIGLAGREARRDDGELHHLFLEDRHAQRARQHALHGVARIRDRLEPLPPAQIGMHHAALDGPRAHDGHLDDQVVELARLAGAAAWTSARAIPPGTRRWCRRAKSSRRRAASSFGTSASVNDLRRKSATSASPRRSADNMPRPSTSTFEQPELVEIVLVPFDDRAIRHGGVFDGHQLFEQPLRDHEAADVLGQVPRKPLQLAGEVEQ